MPDSPQETESFRTHLAQFQDFGDAHLPLEGALAGLGSEHRGVRPPGLPHSVWELVEHIRIAQRDLLDFCTAESYEPRNWPDEYWPATAGPADEAAWDRTLELISLDREGMRRLAHDPEVNLASAVRNATKPSQTYLRSLLLAQDHAAYHVGQIVQVRRLLEGDDGG